MYAQFFNLREMPFSITPDPAYLYLSPRHQEALGHLLFGTGQYGGFVQLTGEVGTGKTTVVRTLLEQKLDGVEVAMVHNPRQSEHEFVQSICDELGVEYDAHPEPTLKNLIDALNRHLLRTHAAGMRTVLIIDEAQNLAPNVLEQVRLLTNLETAKEKLLRIMLVGQPELTELLARPDLRQLASRITARYHLTPLEEDEVSEYLRHRLAVAGCKDELFGPDAVAELYAQTRGIPRLLNALADRALLGAYSRSDRRVTRDMVRSAAIETFGPNTADALGDRRPLGWRRFVDRRSGTGLPRLSLSWIEASLMSLALVIGGALAYQSIQHYSGGSGGTGPSADFASEDGPSVAGREDASEVPDYGRPASDLVPKTPPPSPREVEALAQETVPSVAPPSPAPPPVAVVAPSPQPPAPAASLETLLASKSSLPQLTTQMIRLWDPGLNLPRGENICRALKAEGLECYRTVGNLRDLRSMDRPAILTLTDPEGLTRYALVTELTQDRARFALPSGQSLAVGLDELGTAWNGDMLLLWRRETEEVQLNPGMRGSAVLWLRERVSGMLGKPLQPPVSDVFDAGLREDVRQFQEARGLIADGVVGIRSRIALSDPLPETPTLKYKP